MVQKMRAYLVTKVLMHLNTLGHFSFKSFIILKIQSPHKKKIVDFHKNLSVLSMRNVFTLK
ncbi:hypothetical protein SAMN05421594_4181 [Chryseobacterium oleae]|uniref:Uncharacterized protein n=1 Tax=Chryseobacterium oleae TaxID=491207 RepID=A0A1I5BU45_CHROL|nr:hypothetical protein SAMN05421594_4181 [Chryseobacterium oleae]